MDINRDPIDREHVAAISRANLNFTIFGFFLATVAWFTYAFVAAASGSHRFAEALSLGVAVFLSVLCGAGVVIARLTTALLPDR